SQIVYNLNITERYLSADGRKFVFTIAPNKNSLYPEFMKDGFTPEGKSNRERILPMLSDSDVNFVDLYSLFGSDERILYHSGDSHWNNIGASMAMDAVCVALGKEHTDYSKKEYEVRCDFKGDLYKMVYPRGNTCEDEYYFKDGFSYDYVKAIKSTYDPEISTVSDREGSVVMFRDSFGNTLLPFIANEYKNGYFSRGVPYEMYRASALDADTVIVEVVERNLRFLQQSAPIIAAKEEKDFIIPSPDSSYNGSLEAQNKDITAYDKTYRLLKITGLMDRERTCGSTISYIYMKNKDTKRELVFPAYHTCEGDASEKDAAFGLCAYIDLEEIPAGDYGVSIISDDGAGPVLSDEYLSFTNEYGFADEEDSEKKDEDSGSKDKKKHKKNKDKKQKKDKEKKDNEKEEESEPSEEAEPDEEKVEKPVAEEKKEDTSKDRKKKEETKDEDKKKKQKEEDKPKKDEEEKQEEEEDLVSVANGYIGQSIDALKQVLGNPDSESISPGCNATGGDDGIFKWGELTVYTSSVDPGGEQIIVFVE
ncbi:MAG: hypothetical protein K6F00_05675, partial [Lachnospiraceae bacterium]|nr:hypothetical protein [Lachnospiraceae bacterium]